MTDHDGAGIEAGPVAVSAAAYDTHGVTGVDLLADGGLVGTDTQAPYRFTWEASEGSHTLRTVARDAAGNIGSSPPVAVNVGDTLYKKTWPGANSAPWPAAWVHPPRRRPARLVASPALRADGERQGVAPCTAAHTVSMFRPGLRG
jgi:hypothetical protein